MQYNLQPEPSLITPLNLNVSLELDLDWTFNGLDHDQYPDIIRHHISFKTEKTAKTITYMQDSVWLEKTKSRR